MDVWIVINYLFVGNGMIWMSNDPGVDSESLAWTACGDSIMNDNPVSGGQGGIEFTVREGLQSYRFQFCKIGRAHV